MIWNATRTVIIYLCCVATGLLIMGRIIHLQYFEKMETTSEDISFRDEEIEAVRGSILASDGRLLSTSVPYFQIRMDCIVPEDTLFSNNIDRLALSLSKFFKDKSASAYKNELIKARKEGKRYYRIGNRVVDYGELMQIKKFPVFSAGANRGGIIAEQRDLRVNPFGRLAYRTIGYVNQEGVRVGIEGSFDSYLKGISGRQRVQRVFGGEWKPVDAENMILPKDGSDVQTTIDIEIQEFAETALRNQLAKADVLEGATAVVMEVKSGAIRAMANMKKGKNGEYDESYNYAINSATEPGSTLKLASLVTMIEDNVVTLETPVDAGNGKWLYNTVTFSDVSHGGYGLINVIKAFEKSSNVAFAKLAVSNYEENPKRFVDRMQNLKLTEQLNIEIPGEVSARITTPGEPGWNKVTLPMLSIGYGILLTPLHTLTFYNAIANRGRMLKPYLIDNIQKNGEIVKQFQPQEISGAICSKSTIEAVHKALRGVVVHGTAKAFNDSSYAISGKTGTAQIAMGSRGYIDAQGYRKHQASFAGFFPSEKPVYSIIVVLYTNKTRENFYGGTWAAPVFKEIADKIYSSSPEWKEPLRARGKRPEDNPAVLPGRADKLYSLLSWLPTGDKFPATKAEWVAIKEDSTGLFAYEQHFAADSVPDVTGMGVRDALYLLENRGYIVKFNGIGRVTAQGFSPAVSTVSKGIIYLKLSENYETK